MTSIIDWLNGNDGLYPSRRIIPDDSFPKLLPDKESKPLMNSRPEPMIMDGAKTIPPDYAIMYAKLVRHITEMQGILLADENKTYPVEMLEELDNCVDEAMEFIKLVEILMMNPMQVIKSKDNNNKPVTSPPNAWHNCIEY